jgi:hypothetical protein
MRQRRDKGQVMAELLPLAELEFRIVLLPPISRGAHLGGPALHARRLVKLWKVDGDDDLPLAQAFRLLNAEAVERAIMRSLVALEYPGDQRHWVFPRLETLLPNLREASWQEMLAGTLLTEGKKDARTKQHRTVLPPELARLTPDWELSRLTRGCADEFIDVRVRREPAEPAKKNWREHPSKEKVEAAMQDIAKEYPPAHKYSQDTRRPSLDEILGKLKDRLGDVTRKQARDALTEVAPHLGGRRGYRSA